MANLKTDKLGVGGNLKVERLPEPGDRYQLGDIIGEGVCAKVYKAVDTKASNRNVAIKIQKYLPEMKSLIEDEYRVLRDFSSHTSLPDFYGVYRKKTSEGIDEIWFILELCEAGSVVDIVRSLQVANRRMSEEHIAYILKKVVKALCYLHENHIIHRDVRGNNILLASDGEIKLCDFGLSKDFKATLGKRGTCVGSPCWMAPEVVASNKSDKDTYDARADVWALGITAIELGDGKPPFFDIHPTRALFQILRNPPPSLYRPANWSQNFNDFISECLEKNPDHRPFMVELLEHPFLMDIPEKDFHMGIEIKMQAASCDVTMPKKEEVAIMKGLLKAADTQPEKMFVEDLATLEKLNEESILNEIKNKMKKGEHYFFIGDVLLSVNPNGEVPDYKLGFHSKYKFKARSDNEPHIFAVADSAYQDMLHHEEPQHIIMTGESYSGKSTNHKLLMKHLQFLGMGYPALPERIESGYKVIEALINAGTPLNNNATRSIVQVQITFGQTGKLTGAIYWVYLLEKLRVSSTNMDQSNFHIFYYFFDAMDSEERLDDYSLEAGRNYRYLRIPVSRPTTKIKYVRDDPKGNFEKFKQFEQNLIALDFSLDALETIHRILAAILLLGEVRFTDDSNAELEEPEIVAKIANLLKLDEKKFQWSLMNYCIIVKGSAAKRRHSPDEARDARDVLASTIYNRLVDWIVNTINAKLSLGRAIFGDQHSITLTDLFGFECFNRNHIDQLMVNSINEQFQFLYNQRIFAYEMIETEEEQVPVTPINFYDNKLAVDHLMTKPKGVFCVIDDASKGRHGQGFIIDSLHEAKSPYIKRTSGHEFTVAHYTGKVTYDTRDFADKNRDFIPPEMVETLRASQESVIRTMFSNPLSKTGNLTMALEETLAIPDQKKKKKWGAALVAEKQKAKKINTLSRGQYSQVHKMRTLGSVFRATGLEIFKCLSIGPNSGGTHFIRCIRPELEYKKNGFHDDMVRQQMRALAVLDTAKARQIGFSHRVPFQEFLRRYKFLAFDFDENVEITKDNCRLLLIRLKLEGWVIGKTKVFLKYYNVEYLSRLYENQVKKIIKVQSMMRAFLAKKNISNKIQQVHRQSIRKKAMPAKIETPEEAAMKIQKMYRGYAARKKYRPLINEKTGKLDHDTAIFIKDYFGKWKSKSIYQVLLRYRAARFQDLVNFSQQVHIYNQRCAAGLTTCSKCVLLERIDVSQRHGSLLGTIKPAVWKLRFRLDEIPFFDTSYMCEPGSAAHLYTCGSESDNEDWDAPLRRRKTVSYDIADSSQRNYSYQHQHYNNNEAFDYKLANAPYHREIGQPIRGLTPTTGHRPYNANVREKNHYSENRPHSPIRRPHSPIKRPRSPACRSYSPTNKTSIYSPVPYQRQSVNDIKERFGSQIPTTPMESNSGYKKRPAPKAPNSIGDSHKKGPAPQPIKPWESKGVEYTYERNSSPSTLDPIKELERIGRKNDAENDVTDDNPPFNFQGMLRKTEKRRASMKRSTQDNAFSVTKSIDIDDRMNNNNGSISPVKIETNVIYQSKKYNRPKSSSGKLEFDGNRNLSPSTSHRKYSLSNDAMEDQASGVDRHNNFLLEELVPGIVIEGDAEEL